MTDTSPLLDNRCELTNAARVVLAPLFEAVRDWKRDAPQTGSLPYGFASGAERHLKRLSEALCCLPEILPPSQVHTDLIGAAIAHVAITVARTDFLDALESVKRAFVELDFYWCGDPACVFGLAVAPLSESRRGSVNRALELLDAMRDRPAERPLASVGALLTILDARIPRRDLLRFEDAKGVTVEVEIKPAMRDGLLDLGKTGQARMRDSTHGGLRILHPRLAELIPAPPPAHKHYHQVSALALKGRVVDMRRQ